MSTSMHTSFCRICNHSCPLGVEVQDGRVVRVTGDRENSIYQGYTCVKGRAQPAFLSHPQRLLHTMKRTTSGDHIPIPLDDALDEIADRLHTIIDRHGPRAVAGYFGTMLCAHPATAPVGFAFMQAIASPMIFTPMTIDKPGKPIAHSFHGRWMAPPREFDRPDAGLLVGVNPMVTYKGLPKGNQSRWLRDAQDRGFQLIVIDPRRSDIARRAALHLQPKPGNDHAIIAAILRVIIAEDLYDREFVTENVSGFEEFRRAIERFDPEIVAIQADIPVPDLVAAARIYGRAERAYSMAGTGPHMSGHGTLLEYLMLSLDAVCGNYLRAGDLVRNPGVLIPTRSAKAQASPPSPAYGFGEQMRVRGLGNTAAGMPTAALADEILLEGEGQVRALISCAGNPVGAWPDQLKTIEAMNTLDLLVQIDPWMSQTARMAHYVIAPKMPLEMAGTTQIIDLSGAHAGMGYAAADAYAQYSPAIVDPPEGSELVEEWEFFYLLARRMGIQVVIGGGVLGNNAEPAVMDVGEGMLDEMQPVVMSMSVTPTSDEVLDMVTRGSRIPLDQVRGHPHGALFPDPPVHVAPKDPGWNGRLDVGNADMLDELTLLPAGRDDHEFDLRLVCRRMQHVYNTSCNLEPVNHGRPYNPAFMHPADMERLGLQSGDVVQIESARSSILGIVESDDSLRTGLVSMTHGFGGPPEEDANFRSVGSNIDRLLSVDQQYDPYSGQPLMSNVPVRVSISSSTPFRSGSR
jgi:anaerobic selenocysteine-containing dehydrogenase